MNYELIGRAYAHGYENGTAAGFPDTDDPIVLSALTDGCESCPKVVLTCPACGFDFLGEDGDVCGECGAIVYEVPPLRLVRAGR